MIVAILAVINVGCYVWINNSTAVIPDGDPATMVKLELCESGFGHGDSSDDIITDPQHAAETANKMACSVVHGNGDQDDNRVKSYYYRRVSSMAVLSKTIKSSTTSDERYTTAAYKDFGHLKIMPVGDGIINTFSSSLLVLLKGHPCIVGGLLFVTA